MQFIVHKVFPLIVIAMLLKQCMVTAGNLTWNSVSSSALAKQAYAS